ncbi:MAG: putative Ig domain-containing protein, partial [Verrucomicrobiales bacterium]|nr:putative Ig domain-containing protein [Verrucomicrobiales bacterium]
MNKDKQGSIHAARRWQILACLALFSVFGASSAVASHYRGAAASYTISSSGVVTVTAYTGWGSFIDSPLFNIYTGSGGTGSYVGYMALSASVNPFSTGTELGGSPYTVRKDTFTFNLAGQAAGFYYAWWTSGNYVSAINNVPESTWSLELKIAYTPGVASAGPTMIPATIDIVGRGFPYTQNLNSVDPDGTPVTYTNLSGYVAPDYAPSSLIPGISVSSTGTVSIPPSSTSTLALGRWGYKIRVTDGSGGTAIRDTLLVVNDAIGGTANQPPVLNAIGPKTVNVNSALSFTVSGSDPDAAQNITVRAKLLPSGATCPDFTGPASGASTNFNWTPVPGQEGTYTVVFEVFDSAAVTLVDAEEVTITVTGSNNPPILAAVGNKSVANGGTLTFNLSATDPDGNAITYQMFNGPPGATLSAGGAFSWSPTAGQNNSTFTGVTLRATDNGVPNLFSQESITITVGAGNNAPVTSTASLNLTANVGQNTSFLVSGSDVDSAQTLTLSANAGLPPGASFPTATGLASAGVSSTFSWTPTLAQVGITTVKFLTQDNGSPILNHEITVTINVVAFVNSAPTVANSIPDQNAAAAHPFSFTFAANTFNDSDVGQTLTYGAVGLPAWLTFNPVTRSFNGTPALGDVGTVTITVSATDNGSPTASVTTDFDIVTYPAPLLPMNPASGVATGFVSSNIAPNMAGQSFSGFFDYTLNSGGSVLAHMLTVGPAGITRDSGVYSNASGSIDLLAREGDAMAPGTLGSVFVDFRLADSGTGFFLSQTTGAGVTSVNDYLGFVDDGLAVSGYAREGGQFATLYRGLAVQSGGDFACFPATQKIGGGISTANDTGIFAVDGTTASTSALIQEGETVTGTVKLGTVASRVAVGSDGTAVVYATLTGAPSMANSAVAKKSIGSVGGATVVAQRGATAPGVTGAIFNAFAGESVDPNGNALIEATLKQDATLGITAANDEGLWAERSGTLELVIREGDTVGSAQLGRIDRHSLLADGTVVVRGLLKGAGV